MMLEIRAIVVQVRDGKTFVQSQQAGGCGSCDQKGGCGSSDLSQMFCTEERRFEVVNTIHAEVGDEVVVILPEGALLKSALQMYGLPLFWMLLGAMAGTYWSSDLQTSDLYALVGALFGLSAGFLQAKLSTLNIIQPTLRAIVASTSYS